jgi:hypothetical protein
MADSDDHAVPTAAAAAPPPAPDPPTVPPQSVVDDAAPADLSRVVAKAAASAAPPPVTAAAPKRPAPATATTTTTAALSNMHKAFVGGISWHLNDADLKDSAYERKEDERAPLARCSPLTVRPSLPPSLSQNSRPSTPPTPPSCWTGPPTGRVASALSTLRARATWTTRSR